MKLSELEPATSAIEGEICEAGDNDFAEDSELEGDLQEALKLLEDCLLTMEKIIIMPKDRLVRQYPKHLHDVMLDVSDYLEQWDLPDREDEER